MSTGSERGAIAGAVIGGLLAAPTGGMSLFMGMSLGMSAGSIVGAYADPTRVHGPRLGDAQAQTSSVGGMIPFGYGRFVTAGNVICAMPSKNTKTATATASKKTSLNRTRAAMPLASARGLSGALSGSSAMAKRSIAATGRQPVPKRNWPITPSSSAASSTPARRINNPMPRSSPLKAWGMSLPFGALRILWCPMTT